MTDSNSTDQQAARTHLARLTLIMFLIGTAMAGYGLRDLFFVTKVYTYANLALSVAGILTLILGLRSALVLFRSAPAARSPEQKPDS